MTRIPPVRRLLMDAKALISRPENWCKETMAKNAGGRDVMVHSLAACRFCSDGALYRASHGNYGLYELAGKFTDTFAPGDVDLIGFNDAPSTTHPMIMRLFNKAIRRAKEQGI